MRPTQPGLAIRFNPETKQRSLDTLLWGLVPYWSKDNKTGLINARAERIDTAPAFRRPFQKRRCLIPADGFYEWKKTPEGKIPYSIEMKDWAPFVFAGPSSKYSGGFAKLFSLVEVKHDVVKVPLAKA